MPPKGKKKDAATKPAAAQPELPPPNWPAFKPLIPPSDLSLQEVVPEQIVTLPNFWPSSLCKTYVSFLSSLPLTTTPGKPKKGDAVRVNDRFQIQDPLFAKRLWEETALKDVVLGNVDSEDGLRMTEAERKALWGGEVVGLNPNIRIYRYSKGQFFDQHCKQPRCIGGETVFYPDPLKKASKRDPPPDPIEVGLEVGMALLHKHGADCMLHEGREVLAGEKWVIRSDLCVRR
ncbi:hypothetical protein SLS58_000964 [Diplodia intermedia]|uniref:Prolyl 4-hydroxylase alpha subunit domain-containing protein n=1 Tax=Diplodia intermedia TaxID=856260 RepID=A0ABR3U3H9_9PEZI